MKPNSEIQNPKSEGSLHAESREASPLRPSCLVNAVTVSALAFRIPGFRGTRPGPRNLSLLALGLGLSLRAAPAFGCAACGGQSSDAQAVGMNWGIFSLLAVIALVLGSVGAFFVFLAKRAAAAASALPAPAPQPAHQASLT